MHYHDTISWGGPVCVRSIEVGKSRDLLRGFMKQVRRNNKTYSIVPYLVAFLLVAAVSTPVFAGGAEEEVNPALDIPPQPRQYISPADGDGVQDELVLPFSSVVVPGEDTVIVEYALTVFDGDGNTVYLQREEQPERRGFFGNLFGGEKPRVEIPDTLTWDGRYDAPTNVLPPGVTAGELVPDGEYTYQLSIVDDERNTSTSPPFNVTVDNTPPEVDDFPPLEYRIFAPTGDGLRDVVPFELRGSRELRWIVRIIDEQGENVYEEQFENPTPRRIERDVNPPSRFVWDGTVGTPADTDRPLAPEGTYRLELVGEDRAGNTTTALHPQSVRLSLETADLTLESADGNPWFSPNDNGNRDVLPVRIVTNQPELVERWTMEVIFRDQVVRSESGSGAPPEVWRFDGRRQDGSVLPDVTVILRVRAVLINGTETQSGPLSVHIDTTPPVTVAALDTIPEATSPGDPIIFGAGDKTGITGTVRYERDVTWKFQITLEDQEIVAGTLQEFLDLSGVHPRRVPNTDLNEIELAWDGEVFEEVGAVPDGRYELVLEGRDRAGNVGRSRNISVIKDTRTPRVTLSTEDRNISPMSASPLSEIEFEISYGVPERIREFRFEIRNEEGRVVRSEYRQRPFEVYNWTGLTNAGTVVPDGEYTAGVEVFWQNGHSARVSGVGPITVDRTPPRIERLVPQYRVFYPTGDGQRDTVRIDQRVVPGDDWTGEVLDEEDNVVLRVEYTDEVEPVVWDGRDADGEIVEDGDYRYVLSSVDRAGNRTSATITVEVNTVMDAPELAVTLDPQPYSPEAEGVDGVLKIRLLTESMTLIREWEVEIRDPQGRPFRTFSGEGDPPPTIEWAGLSDDGTLVRAAERYPLTFTVRDHMNNVVSEDATITIARFGPPVLGISLEPIPFAPNGDGNNDVLTIGLSVQAQSRIQRWVVEILDPHGRPFSRFSGTGDPPPRIRWDGLSDEGELVQSAMDYPVRFTVHDDIGNVVTEEATIATDILVMREEGRLRIRISSIHFAGNTPDLFMSERDKLEENLVTLRRLAQILNRYPQRQIIVEGHAAHVFLQTPESIAREQREELLPLSRRRAEEVIKALIILGVDRDRMSIQAHGGNRPVVPHSDLENLWKNRRVEFLLDEE